MTGKAARIFAFIFSLALSLYAAIAFAGRDKDGFVSISPEEVVWNNVPLIKGLQVATIDGDPRVPGAIYVQRVKFSSGVMTPPHYHPQDRNVVVLEGTWYAGIGRDFDPNKTVAMRPGSYLMQPANAVHYDGAKDEEVIVQITGVGPAATIPANP
jgi:quercetin dioxygenase-like cupin family protein